MTLHHNRKGAWMDWRKGYTGAPLSTIHIGSPAQKILSNLMQWRQLEYIASYSGRVDNAINGDGDSDFHIITHCPDKTDSVTTTRQLGAHIQLWQHDYRPADLNVDWHDPFDGAAAAMWDLSSDYATGVDDVAGDEASGPEKFLYDGLTVVPPGGLGDGFRHSKLVVDNGAVASLSFWEMPETELTAEQLQVLNADVGVSEIIRGFDTTLGNSLGALLHLVGSGAAATEAIERLSRRCLFQTPYPVGTYQTNTGGWENFRQDGDGNGWKYRFKVRNLQEKAAGTQLCYPAMVITADAGVDIRYTADSGDFWTYTVPGGGLTDSLVTFSDGTGDTGVGLEVDNDAIDYVVIEVNADVAEECLLQTVSLWEGPEYT